MTALFRILDQLESWLKKIAAACLMVMALLTGADIICRAAFNSPILGVEELVAILAVAVTGFSLAYAHSEQSNIGVEFLVSRLSSEAQRRIKCCTDFVSFLLFGLVSGCMFVYSGHMKGAGTLTMTLGLPVYPVVFVLGIGFTALALVQLRDVARFFVKEA